MVELWLVVEPQVNNTLYWAKEFFYSASFSVEELNETGETEFESRRFLNQFGTQVRKCLQFE